MTKKWNYFVISFRCWPRFPQNSLVKTAEFQTSYTTLLRSGMAQSKICNTIIPICLPSLSWFGTWLYGIKRIEKIEFFPPNWAEFKKFEFFRQNVETIFQFSVVSKLNFDKLKRKEVKMPRANWVKVVMDQVQFKVYLLSCTYPKFLL